MADGDGAKQDGQYRAQHIECQRVDTERFKEARPAAFLALDIDKIDEHRLDAHGHAARDEHKRRRPHLLAARNAILQQPAGQQHDGAPQQHCGHALGIVVDRQYHAAHQIADEHVGNARQGAQDALGIKGNLLAIGALVVHVVGAQDAVVDLGDDVVERELIAVSKAQYQRIGHQNDAHKPRDELALEQHGAQ